MMHHLEGTILNNVPLSPSIFSISLKIPSKENFSIQPGQFIMLSCPGNQPVFFKRPFSVFFFEDDIITIVYKVVGAGSQNLSQLYPGMKLDMVLPCGNNFEIPPTGNLLFIGGGLGIAPLHFLCQKALSNDITRKISLYYGSTHEHERVLFSFEPHENINLFYHSDYTGNVYTDHLFSYFIKNPPPFPVAYAYACGPFALMRAISGWTLENNIPLQVSLENHMACGTGSCLGCSIKTRDGMKTVCHDGPVFSSLDVLWDQK